MSARKHDLASIVHAEYLPFTGAQLLDHFAWIHGDDDATRERFLDYYTAVARANTASSAGGDQQRAPAAQAVSAAAASQIQGDERFWVATGLMSLMHGTDPAGAFAALLCRAYPDGPASDLGGSWRDLLEGQLRLVFEANLPSPKAYRTALAGGVHEGFLLPRQRDRLASRGARPLEGATKADAVIVNEDTGFAVIFEAKVLSDVSTTVTYDARRNQLARLLDVSLEAPVEPKGRSLDPALLARDPARTCVVLLTPETFREDRTSRLYGWLHREYRSNPASLQRHLPHRSLDDCWQVGQRLGWATWEDVNAVRPSSLPWLPERQTDHHSPSALVTAEGPNTSA